MSEFTEKSLIKYNLLHNGDVAQLGECRVRNAKVGSSILLVSTIIKGQPFSVALSFCAPGMARSALTGAVCSAVVAGGMTRR